jgi:RloB-like protein
MAIQDKKQKEKQKAEEHKQRLADIKARRRGEPIIDRNAPILNETPIFLIYCEGKNTEPSYFNKFKFPFVTIKSFGEGKNTLSLVERAKQLADEAVKSNRKYDQIWCVFDADPKPDNPYQAENFSNAIKKAESLGFGVAYSNQAFEYWLILHFEDHQGGSMDRQLYGDKINAYLKPFGVFYDFNGDKKINQDFFNLLQSVAKTDKHGKDYTRADLAKIRAEKIYNQLENTEESSTSVFKLIDELMKYNV